MVSSCLKNVERCMFFSIYFCKSKERKTKFPLDLLNGAHL